MLCGQTVMQCQRGLQVPPASQDNSSDKLIVISGSTTSATHLTLQSFLFCAFLVPLWLMCLTRYMLPLRQEQLTASLTMPQVPRMTQSNRIRVCVWGGGCACVCVRAQKKHPWSSLLLFFLTSLCQRRRKVQQLGWANALAAVLLRKNKTRGGEMGIWEGDSLQSATMVYVPKAEISA